MIYAFGEWTLDVARRELRHRDYLVAIEPKMFEVLLYLLQHRDRVVTKDELFAQCWPNTFVTEAALTRCLTKLRKVMQQGLGSTPAIKTIHRQGYRFVVPVEPLPQPLSPDPHLPYTPPAVPPSPAVPSVSPPAPLPLSPIPGDDPPTATASPSLSVATVKPNAERRQLTVLCCELVGLAQLVVQLDPEDLHTVLHPMHAACAAVIAQFDGHMAQQLDDGLVVYFGYPYAHEDAAQRAVRTGLRLLETLRKQPPIVISSQAITLTPRIGIHTGAVVVEPRRPSGATMPVAVGATATIAAALRDQAAPGTVVISAATAYLVEGYFTWQLQGLLTLSGQTQPLIVYQVTGASDRQTRLDVAAGRGLTPFVGRAVELALLQERWQQVQDGMGQVVIISGEAGIGKSRLVRMLRDTVADEAPLRLECRCSPYYQHTALYPLIEMLRRALQDDSATSDDEKVKALEQLVHQYHLDVRESVTLLASLLAITPPAERYPPLDFTPQRQRQRTMEILLAMVLALTQQQPLLFIVEDVHWIDPSTLEWLGLLVDQGPTIPILSVLTCRPTFQPPWGLRTTITPIALSRLSRQQVAQMVTQVARGKRFPSELVEQIVAKTDGVPLFVEEVTKLVLASGLLQERNDHYTLTGPVPSVAIPATLHDSLTARLDHVGMAKRTAQLGATIGRRFAYSLLQAVSRLDEAMLQEDLRQLVAAELLYQRGVGAQATYIFTHMLLQEAAYQSLLRNTRQQYHQRIAHVIEEQFPEVAILEPELVAHHYTEAGLAEQAVSYWQQAGAQATDRSAYLEAIVHLTKGLEVLQTLPDTPVQMQHELTLQLMMGSSLVATQGYAAPGVERTYRRAQELCQQMGISLQNFPVLWNLWNFYNMRSEHQLARELADQLFTLAEQAQDPALLLEAHDALGQTAFFRGEFTSALTHMEQVKALYDLSQHSSLALLYGQEDPGVICRSFMAWTLWMLGYPEQALSSTHNALTLASELKHPHTMAHAIAFYASLYQYRQEEQTTYNQAEAVVLLAAEQGFPHWSAVGIFLQGWVLARRGLHEEGLSLMSQGFQMWQATGSELAQPYILSLFAEVYGIMGQPDKGRDALNKARVFIDTHSERYWEAEHHRLEGELLLMETDKLLSQESKKQQWQEAEVCFRRALDTARRQQAKSLELRAAMSLSRLWQQQDRQKEAFTLLADIYNWFTEGFDTPDLQTAKTLLEELSR